MKLFWISWVQPSKDYRPLSFPPTERVLGYWCTGYTDAGATLCAAVEANSKEELEGIVKTDWPEFQAFRFVQERRFWTTNERFFPEGWAKERLQKWEPGQSNPKVFES